MSHPVDLEYPINAEALRILNKGVKQNHNTMIFELSMGGGFAGLTIVLITAAALTKAFVPSTPAISEVLFWFSFITGIGAWITTIGCIITATSRQDFNNLALRYQHQFKDDKYVKLSESDEMHNVALYAPFIVIIPPAVAVLYGFLLS